MKCCEVCKTEMRDATAEDQDGLILTLPIEQWMCPRCLNNEIQKVITTTIPP